jgi:hypothetical protein
VLPRLVPPTMGPTHDGDPLLASQAKGEASEPSSYRGRARDLACLELPERGSPAGCADGGRSTAARAASTGSAAAAVPGAGPTRIRTAAPTTLRATGLRSPARLRAAASAQLRSGLRPAAAAGVPAGSAPAPAHVRPAARAGAGRAACTSARCPYPRPRTDGVNGDVGPGARGFPVLERLRLRTRPLQPAIRQMRLSVLERRRRLCAERGMCGGLLCPQDARPVATLRQRTRAPSAHAKLQARGKDALLRPRRTWRETNAGSGREIIEVLDRTVEH